MPAYQTTPFKQSPALLVSGTPSYVFGSFDDRSSPTVGNVISDSSVTTTATVTFMVQSGNTPKVGELISVVGAGRSNNFNVTNATILSVVAAVDGNSVPTGVVTVTYAISSTSLGTAADTGTVMVPRPEVGESLSAGTTASVPVAAPFNNPNLQQGRTIGATVTFPVAPQQGTVFLQGAMQDLDSEYENIGTVAGAGSVAVGPTLEVSDMSYRFYRLRAVGITGAGTCVGKITC
jgi:hypothetical protein